MPDYQITLSKRICIASDGYQFVTSGFPNRSRDYFPDIPASTTFSRLGESGEKMKQRI